MEQFTPIPSNLPEVQEEEPLGREEQDLNISETMGNLISTIMEEAEQIEIKENDRNGSGELTVSPEGPVSNLGKQSELWWKIARTESFKKFFGDWQNKDENSSKVTDKNGEPLVVFRGLKKEISFSDFYDPEKYKSEFLKSVPYGEGVYFTPMPVVANTQYAGNEGNIFCAFVNARKPSYATTFVGNLSIKLNKLIVMLPEVLANRLKKIPLLDNDSVFGTSSAIGDDKKQAQYLYEMVLKDPEQMLVIPSPIKRIEKSISSKEL